MPSLLLNVSNSVESYPTLPYGDNQASLQDAAFNNGKISMVVTSAKLAIQAYLGIGNFHFPFLPFHYRKI